MKNLFSRFKKDPNNQSSPDDDFNWNEWFENKASYVYAPQRLSTEAIINAIKEGVTNYFGTDQMQETSVEQALVFIIEDAGKFKSLIKLGATYHLYIQPRKGYWALSLATAEWTEDDNHNQWPIPQEINNLSGISQSALMAQIEKNLSDLLPSHYLPMKDGDKNHQEAYIAPAGRYVEEIKNRYLLWQLAFLAIDEPLITWLGISAIKQSPANLHEDSLKDHDCYYWATDKRTGIVGFNKNSYQAHVIDLSGEALEVKSVLGRDEVKQAGWEWLTNLGNDLQYVEIQGFISLTDSAARLRECARLNWLKDAKDKPSDDYAFTLIRRLASIGQYPFDDLALLCMSLTNKKRQIILHQENTDDELLHQIHGALTNYQDEQELPQWVESWQISPESASSILAAFLALSPENTNKHLLPLHQWVRTQLLKKQKPLKKYDKWESALLQRLNFEFEYLRHLISCEAYHEALSLANELFACLPDESAQDLIANLELEDTTRRQTYRIQLLDFIVQAKNGAPTSVQELRHLAMLDPLRLPRLKALASASNGVLKERVNACMHMLSQGSFITSPYPIHQLPKSPLQQESLTQVKGLISSGILSKVQSWIAAVRLPDLSQVRSYNELIAAHNDREQILKKVASIQMLLSITPVECYITRGEKAGEIRAYGGLDTFMLVGHHLIDKNGPRYAGDAEQVYLLASEMAHIKFKHAKITSSDVWRGGLEKGFFAVQLLPILGSAFKALSIPSIKVPISPIVEKGSKAMKHIEDMGLLEYAKMHMDSYMNNGTEEVNDGEKLLEVSQFMQFVADRIGLIACGNIQAAVRAIFHNSDQYFKNIPFVTEFGLSRLAKQENTDGQTAYQLLNLRIASLISFYLSETYSQARKEAMDGLDL